MRLTKDLNTIISKMNVYEIVELNPLYNDLKERFNNDTSLVFSSIYKIGFIMGQRKERTKTKIFS